MRFTFKNKQYDKNQQYYLVVYDEATGTESFRSFQLPPQLYKAPITP